MKRSKMSCLIENHARKTGHGMLALAIAGGVLASPTSADLTFTQTVDNWWSNTYTWNAQVEQIVCQRRCEVRGGCALNAVKSLESSRFGLRMTDFKKNLTSQLDFE